MTEICMQRMNGNLLTALSALFIAMDSQLKIKMNMQVIVNPLRVTFDVFDLIIHRTTAENNSGFLVH